MSQCEADSGESACACHGSAFVSFTEGVFSDLTPEIVRI